MTLSILAGGISLVAETLPLFMAAIDTVRSSFARFENKEISKEELLKQWRDAGIHVQTADANLEAAMDEALRKAANPNPNTISIPDTARTSV